jgi:PAS domain S-box-containing protein
MTLQEVAWQVSIAVGSIAVLTFIWTKMIAPFYSYLKASKERDRKIDLLLGKMNTIEALDTKIGKIDSIYEQLHPNGGKTLADKIDRIESIALNSNQSIKAVASSMGIGMWKSDVEGNCIEASDELCNILRCSESEILGSNWSQVVHPEDRENVWKEWSFCVRNKTNFNMRYRTIKNGEPNFYVHGTAYHTFKNGKSIGLIGLLKKESNVPKI